MTTATVAKAAKAVGNAAKVDLVVEISTRPRCSNA